MSDVPISIASGEYDRIRAIRDGLVKVEGCAVTYHVVEPNQLFVRNLKNQEFDVSEMSFSTYIALRDQGKAHYTAIPVFLSRAFRHSAIFVRTDRGIASPTDLRGKRVGTPEYFTTMLVWMRGLLSDEYGIKPSDLRWRLGPLEQPAREVSPPLADGAIGDGVTISPPDPSPAEPRYSEGSATQQSDRSRQQPTSVGGGEEAWETAAPPAVSAPQPEDAAAPPAGRKPSLPSGSGSGQRRSVRPRRNGPERSAGAEPARPQPGRRRGGSEVNAGKIREGHSESSRRSPGRTNAGPGPAPRLQASTPARRLPLPNETKN